jgi:DNA-binding SARP family transcriptional activator/tetratricopeptide (TPR) repeat protein
VRDVEQGRSLRPRSLSRLAGVLGLDAAGAGVAREPGAVLAGPGLARRAVRAEGLWVSVLGPLEAWRAGSQVGLGPVRQRAVLGLLALSPGELVSRESVVDALWGEDPPATAVSLVQAHVSRLRAVLDPDRSPRGGDGLLVSAGTGYRLRVSADQLDLLAFEQITGRARAVRRSGDALAACGLHERALGLWRGVPLADLGLLRGHLAVAHVAGRYAAAVMDYAEAAVAAGCAERVLWRLEALMGAEPLNERAGALLMTVLASAGRADAALRVYQELRSRLAEQLGMSPGPELADAHLRVLRQEIPGACPGGPPGPAGQGTGEVVSSAVPRQLPPAVAHFAGRRGELMRLTALLAGTHPVAVISAISGTAGVGKTALAVRWAHQVAGSFPDGQLYVNLRGYDPGAPVPAADALAGFLRALGVPGQDIPAGLDERAARYRSLLAGRRVLVVLDNARDAGQVRPLLPGAPGCLVVVTSRDALAGLIARDGAERVDLDLLPLADAVTLLRSLIGSRAGADPSATAALAARCARLPLALRIAAELAAARPAVPLAELAGELAGQQQRLDLLQAAGDDHTAVRAVFSWSCQNLSPPAARLFRLLGLHPGAEVTACAAASLTRTTPAKARPLLAELARAHLLTEQVPGRFGRHDLLRAYAIELAATTVSRPDRRAALGRLLDYYLHTAAAADHLLYPLRQPVTLAAPGPGVTPEHLASHDQALAWLDAEHHALVAAVALAADHGFDAHTWQLAYCLETFLYRRIHWQDWAGTQRTALAAAHRLGDSHAQTHAHSGVANAQVQTGRTVEALSHLATALRLRQDAADVAGQARVHLYTGRALAGQGRYRDALARSRQSLQLARAAGAPAQPLVADALNQAGWYLAQLGHHQQALGYCQQAVSLGHRLGHRQGLASSLGSLAYVYQHLGRHGEAADCYRCAVDLTEELGDLWDKAQALSLAGDAHHADGNLPAARQIWTQALAILNDLHHPDAEPLRAKLRPARTIQ